MTEIKNEVKKVVLDNWAKKEGNFNFEDYEDYCATIDNDLLLEETVEEAIDLTIEKTKAEFVKVLIGLKKDFCQDEPIEKCRGCGYCKTIDREIGELV